MAWWVLRGTFGSNAESLLDIKYTKLDNDFYQAFQAVAINELGSYDGEYEENPSNIISFNDYIKNRP